MSHKQDLPHAFKANFAKPSEQAFDQGNSLLSTRSEWVRGVSAAPQPMAFKQEPVRMPERLVVFPLTVGPPAFPSTFERTSVSSPSVGSDTRTQGMVSSFPAAALQPEKLQPEQAKVNPTPPVNPDSLIMKNLAAKTQLVALSKDEGDFLTGFVQKARMNSLSKGPGAIVVQREPLQDPVVAARPEESKLLSQKSPQRGSGAVAPSVLITQRQLPPPSNTYPHFYKPGAAQPKPLGPLEGVLDVSVNDYKGKGVVEQVGAKEGAMSLKPGPQPFVMGKGTAFDARMGNKGKSAAGSIGKTIKSDAQPQAAGAVQGQAERMQPIVAHQAYSGQFGMPPPIEPARTAVRAVEPRLAQTDLSQKLQTVVCQNCKQPKDRDAIYTDVKCNKFCTVCKDCMYSAVTAVPTQPRCPKCSRSLTDIEVETITVYWMSAHQA